MSSRRPGTSHPHLSRVRALSILFQADLLERDPLVVLEEVRSGSDSTGILDDHELTGAVEAADDEYAAHLVAGVVEQKDVLDAQIQAFSHRWKLERMPGVDRNILRIAAFELANEDLPPAVVIDEAVEMAKDRSTANSPTFINGVLEAIRHELQG